MARKKVVPEYGTIMKRGVQYYRTRMQDADGKWISLYAQTPEELYDKSIEMKRSIEDEIFRKNNPTVAEYCEKWLKMRSASVRENTLSGYERTIRKYIKIYIIQGDRPAAKLKQDKYGTYFNASCQDAAAAEKIVDVAFGM